MTEATNEHIHVIDKDLKSLIQQVTDHPLFTHIKNIQDLKTFSEYHVFAVWDFMCLLKRLQSQITCVAIPWLPPKNNVGSRLINEIVTDEEADVSYDGSYLSHFEIYKEAMKECGANTFPMDTFLEKLRQGQSFEKAIEAEDIPAAAKQFVKSTFEIITWPAHKTMAAFIYGREDITDKMFFPIVNNLTQSAQNTTKKFQYYFKRHIELDEGIHAPKARRLLASLCGDDASKWQEANQAAKFALMARCDFLQGIYQAVKKQQVNA